MDATSSSGRSATTSRVHRAPALSLAITGGSRGSRTWYPFSAITSSVNECGVKTPATSREAKTVTIIRITESMFPVCSSMIALMAMAIRVHPPSAAPAPSTAYTVGCATCSSRPTRFGSPAGQRVTRGAPEDEVGNEEAKGEGTPDDEEREKVIAHREGHERGVRVRPLVRVAAVQVAEGGRERTAQTREQQRRHVVVLPLLAREPHEHAMIHLVLFPRDVTRAGLPLDVILTNATAEEQREHEREHRHEHDGEHRRHNLGDARRSLLPRALAGANT